MTLPKFPITENPNLIITFFGFFVLCLALFQQNSPIWQKYGLGLLAGIIFGWGLWGLDRTQKLKDQNLQKEIEFKNKQIEGQKLLNEKLLEELAKGKNLSLYSLTKGKDLSVLSTSFEELDKKKKEMILDEIEKREQKKK